MKKLLLPLFGCLLLLSSACTKDYIYRYEVEQVSATDLSAQKGKLKTPEQYIAILHVNLFNIPMSSNDMYRLSQVYQSIGDKEVAQEQILSNFMNDTNTDSYAFQKGYQVVKPTDSQMRSNLSAFMTDTYNRFYLRYPTEAELEWWTQYLNAYTNITPEMVFFSFAISNEYQYY